MNDLLKIINGDALTELKKLPSESVHCCVTSPPYWGLRDYGVTGQYGLEKTPALFIDKMVEVFAEVKRVLRSDGTLWLNMGDCYAAGRQGRCDVGNVIWHKPICKKYQGEQRYRGIPTGLKPKNLVGLPWMLAFALRADGWYLRSDIIWAKPNPMPESVTDRPTKAHEYIFLLSKSPKYYYDAAAIREVLKPSTLNDARLYKENYECGRPERDYPGEQPSRGGGLIKRKVDKQRGHSRRHEGFNDRWDNMTKEDQCAMGANRRSVWNIATQPYTEAHFATFPEELPKLCILAGCPAGGIVLDPFAGSGTTGQVALELGRKAILIELNPKYIPLIEKRTMVTLGMTI